MRAKQDNPRIRNQKGAFILVNANEACDGDGFDGERFMDLVMNQRPDELSANLCRITNNELVGFDSFKGITEWALKFNKVRPYDINNKYKLFREDPFSLNRLLYREAQDDRPLVFFIPPHVKKDIIQGLEMLGFTDDFIYPELDTVFISINKENRKEKAD